ncbi:unnamed protein product, partial [Polarella glacialis]
RRDAGDRAAPGDPRFGLGEAAEDGMELLQSLMPNTKISVKQQPGGCATGPAAAAAAHVAAAAAQHSAAAHAAAAAVAAGALRPGALGRGMSQYG